jgi:glycine/D-amino acid oxidase-like deaminating enzyme
MNVCTRPFRAQGPRIESERIGRKSVVHNYGHGGSGWSLSWGSGQIAVEMAKAAGRKEIAVIGCGAIGLTTALVAQQAGMRVTIYAKERPPYARSHRATGAWTPDSRICTEQFAPNFAKQWETMARYSFRRYQSLLGVAGDPIEWRDMYSLSDVPFGTPQLSAESGEPEYPNFENELIQDITPQAVTVGTHPFPAPYVQRRSTLLFNIAEYTRLLMADFLANGGVMETFALQDKSDFAAIDERTIINCTGYGARALLADDSIIPVRGQTAKLMPQPELDYGFYYNSRHVAVYPRRDGLLVQAQAEGDFNNDAENLNPEESIAAVQRIGEIVAQMQNKV